MSISPSVKGLAPRSLVFLPAKKVKVAWNTASLRSPYAASRNLRHDSVSSKPFPRAYLKEVTRKFSKQDFPAKVPE